METRQHLLSGAGSPAEKPEKAHFQYREEIREALHRDFQKHPSEVDLTEIYAVTSEIKHTLRHLRRWMKPRVVDAPLPLIGSSSRIRYEPKGVVLIISPWNFPVNLTFGPLVSAIAAGNAVMLKPSEMTPHASAIMRRIVEEVFPPEEVAVVEGGVETSQALLKLPFNHLFFTGSPAIGKIVMKAAAENLASVTLELGGKSPTIVDETANLSVAAKRIAWGKFLNNGQVCLSPDYLLVHRDKKEALLREIEGQVRRFYSDDPKEADSYARLVNQRHFERVKSYLDDAVQKGARLKLGGQTTAEDRYIAPTVVEDIPEDSLLMKEEIFGPVLPVQTFERVEEAIEIVNRRERPLALYLYSRKGSHIDKVLRNTRSGAVCINHNAIHFFNSYLPFGGSNHSGIGRSHGRFGFEAFSNAKAVFKQSVLPSTMDLLTPPYNKWKQRLVDLTIKWF